MFNLYFQGNIFLFIDSLSNAIRELVSLNVFIYLHACLVSFDSV